MSMLDTRIIREIQFRNYKVLKHATLPLAPVTLLVGPNGSGKSTALKAFDDIKIGTPDLYGQVVSISSRARGEPVTVQINWAPSVGNTGLLFIVRPGESRFASNSVGAVPMKSTENTFGNPVTVSPNVAIQAIQSFRTFSLVPRAAATPVHLRPHHELGHDASGLAGVLDRLRDSDPESFERFNTELTRWLPDFDRLQFETPSEGTRSIALRVKSSHVSVPARELSEGTLLALTFLVLAYAPTMPRIFALEEPERGLHPRLLALVRDTLFRLAQPHEFGDQRDPRQVIVTTHSPYFLDLFRDTPESVVIADRQGDHATFTRLTDREDVDQILAEGALGMHWYSGILGGVPDRP